MPTFDTVRVTQAFQSDGLIQRIQVKHGSANAKPVGEFSYFGINKHLFLRYLKGHTLLITEVDLTFSI